MRCLPAVFVFLALASSSLPAQLVLSGTVSDAATGEPLPAANIQIENSYDGTISNNQGRYTLDLPELPVVLIVSYIGYQTARVQLDKNPVASLNIRLQPISYRLEAVEVSGEDPAMAIMRRVIAEKKKWRAKLLTYTARAYTRSSLENDTSIVSISESISETYWDSKRGLREVILSKNQTRNVAFGDNFAIASLVQNFYDDDIHLQGFDMIGPTHPDALKHYRFRLLGERRLDEKIVYDIEVRPRGRLQPTFTGQLSVLDGVFALLQVELKPAQHLLFPQPIQSWELSYSQQFSNFGREFWFPVDVRIAGKIRIGFTGLQFPAISYQQLSRLTAYQVNVPLADSLFKKGRHFRENIIDSTTATIEAARIPLSLEETEAFVAIDSSASMAKAFQPTGVLARFVEIEEGEEAGGNKRSFPDRYLSWEPRLWFNRVDGVHAGILLESDISRHLQFRLHSGYRSEQPNLSFGSGGRYTFFSGRRRRGYADVAWFSGSDTRYSSANYNRFLNSILPLAGLDDYFDYFQRRGYRLEGAFRRGDLAVSATWLAEEHRSLARKTSYALLNDPGAQRINPAIAAGEMKAVQGHLVLGEAYTPFGVVGQTGFGLHFEHSSRQLGSDFSFTRYDADLNWRIPTVLRRRLLPNVLDLRLVGGMIDGSPPPQRLGILDGRLGGFTPFGTFRTLGGLPYEGDSWLALFWEHNFRTVLFELLHLRPLARRNIGFIVHGAAGRTWLPEDVRKSMTFSPRVSRQVHHEIGLSLTGLFGLLRLDMAQRLHRPGTYVGFGATRFF